MRRRRAKRAEAEVPSSAEERLERLRKQVLAANEEVLQASRLFEMYQVAATEQGLFQRLGKGPAATGFLIVRDALHKATILALMRIWDRTRQGNLRMDDIATSLRDPLVRSAIKARRRASLRGSWEAPFFPEDLPEFRAERLRALENADHPENVDADRIVDDTLAAFFEHLDCFDGVEGGSVLDSLMRMRHSRIAHREVDERASPVRTAQYGDARLLLQRTLQMIALARLAVDDCDSNFSTFEEKHRRFAVSFWERVQPKPTLEAGAKCAQKLA